jgi:hypothetical protein
MHNTVFRKFTIGTLTIATLATMIPATSFAASSSSHPQMRHAQQYNTMKQKASSSKNDGETKDDTSGKATYKTASTGSSMSKHSSPIRTMKKHVVKHSSATGSVLKKGSPQPQPAKKPIRKKHHRARSSSSARMK